MDRSQLVRSRLCQDFNGNIVQVSRCPTNAAGRWKGGSVEGMRCTTAGPAFVAYFCYVSHSRQVCRTPLHLGAAMTQDYADYMW